MRIKLPKISKKIYEEDIIKILNSNFNEFGHEWLKHQVGWITNTYLTYKDHDKFLIVIYLIKKTLDFYHKNFIKFSLDDFYSQEKLEIENFNISELANSLYMPKETARRKVVQLEKDGAISRKNKKIILDRSVFPYVKPIDSTKRTANFLSHFSFILKRHKIIENSINKNFILEIIQKDFTHCWRLYYELQIPILLNWKKYFKDLETWHIFGFCGINKSYNKYFKEEKKTLHDYVLSLQKKRGDLGLNAMTISELTNIPRATVIRKLKWLIQSQHLIVDEKKRYHLSGKNHRKIYSIFKENISYGGSFATNIYNHIIQYN